MAILQHIRDTRGHSQVIFQNILRAITTCNKISATNMGPHLMRWGHAFTLLTIINRTRQYAFWKNTVLNHLLIVIKVINKHIQGFQTLLKTAFSYCPIMTGNHSWNQIHRPNAVNITSLTVNSKRDTKRLHRKIGSLPELYNLFIC